ncbi:winged helix-turn-helix transcriptional regulator [Embleya hyalina]|uniref:winged helix-turn-helix transcriptional regulator n=1 Tax=Embleya hyalina TaxID=516124 RepID=UPI000F8278E0|nr:helix-turn-helix domain-containing protein [Embleya hyalina]
MSQRNICVTEAAEVTQACRVLDVLNRVAGKWSISVLMEVRNGPVRFTELERAIHGISRRMLTLTLRSLERDGLLIRTVHPSVPPKVEYEATVMARELFEYLSGLTAWAERHEPAVTASREAYDRAAG